MPSWSRSSHSMIAWRGVHRVAAVAEPHAFAIAAKGRTDPGATRPRTRAAAAIGAITFSGSVIALRQALRSYKFRLIEGAGAVPANLTWCSAALLFSSTASSPARAGSTSPGAAGDRVRARRADHHPIGGAHAGGRLDAQQLLRLGRPASASAEHAMLIIAGSLVGSSSMAPTITTADSALVTAISGVCSAGVTVQTTW